MGAVMVGGCRNTPLHPLGSLDDHAYVLEDAGIETLIFDPAFAERAGQLRERVPGSQEAAVLRRGDVGENLVALAATFEPQPLVGPRVDPEDLSALAYTGGTTGKPKGVMNTYRGSATMAQIMVSEWQWPDEVRHLVCTPLSHAGSSLFVPLLLRGGSMVVLPRLRRRRRTRGDRAASDHHDDAGAVDDLRPARPPAIRPDRPVQPADHLLRCLADVAGPPAGGDRKARPDLLPVLRSDRVSPDGLRPPQGGARSRRPRPTGVVRPAGAVGSRRPARRRRPRGPAGRAGRVVRTGPAGDEGLLEQARRDGQALEGGWLHTGDVAREDEHGFLTIVDRKKDMIVSGGFNIFPREVEDVISTHPAVAAVAVIGVPDDKWGEAVKAVVVPRPGDELDVDELIALVKERKGSHHAPKSVDIVDSIPMSPLGKPDKKALRARYWVGRRPTRPLAAVCRRFLWSDAQCIGPEQAQLIDHLVEVVLPVALREPELGKARDHRSQRISWR